MALDEIAEKFGISHGSVHTIIHKDLMKKVCMRWVPKELIWYDTIYLLTVIGLTPGGSSTVHIYTQTIHRTIQ